MLKPSEQIAQLSPERLQLFLDVAREGSDMTPENFDKFLLTQNGKMAKIALEGLSLCSLIIDQLDGLYDAVLELQSKVGP